MREVVKVDDRASFEDGEGRMRVGRVVALVATLQLEPLQQGDTTEPPIEIEAALLTRRIPLSEVTEEARAQSSQLGGSLVELRARVAEREQAHAAGGVGPAEAAALDVARELLAIAIEAAGVPASISQRLSNLAEQLIEAL